MTIDYFKTIGKHINNFDFKIGEDVILQDDGNGVYIKEWNLAEAQPTMEELIATYNNNQSVCSVCACNCALSSKNGGICSCAGKILRTNSNITLNSRTYTTMTYSTNLGSTHDCLNELVDSTGLATIKKTRKVSIDFLATVDDLSSSFEVGIYKNNSLYAYNTVSSSLVEDCSVSVESTMKVINGDVIKIVLYCSSLLNRNISSSRLLITTVEE